MPATSCEGPCSTARPVTVPATANGCDSGGGHAVSVLAIGYPGGRMHQISLRKEQAAHVKQCLENCYAPKAALEEICEINQRLLRAKPAAAGRKGRKK